MNRYLKLASEVIDSTWKGKLDWHQVPNEIHAQLISEPWNVMRQFQTPYVFEGSPATLICVEKLKYLDEEYLFPYKDRMCELLILVDGKVVERITPPKLPWFWLSKFADAIVRAKDAARVPAQA
jgi:hypothetical protein